MKCFKCKNNCITKYNQNEENKVESVQKVCTKCGWESMPTFIPKPRSEL